MHRTRDFDRVVVDASPFFRFGSAGYLINLVSYVGPKLVIARSGENELERNANDQRFAFLSLDGRLRLPSSCRFNSTHRRG